VKCSFQNVHVCVVSVWCCTVCNVCQL